MFGSSSTMRMRRTMGSRSASRSLDECKPARERQGEREAGTFARAARDPHAAAEVLDDPAADVQPQPAALRLAGKRIAYLAEFLENDFLVGGADADAVIAHLHARIVIEDFRERADRSERRA